MSEHSLQVNSSALIWCSASCVLSEAGAWSGPSRQGNGCLGLQNDCCVLWPTWPSPTRPPALTYALLLLPTRMLIPPPDFSPRLPSAWLTLLTLLTLNVLI